MKSIVRVRGGRESSSAVAGLRAACTLLLLAACAPSSGSDDVLGAGEASGNPSEESSGSSSGDPSEAPDAEVAGVPYPADNPPSAAKTELGRLLFWDPILSGDRDIACGTCHHPAFAYTDGRALSIGTGDQVAARSSMTILDVGWNGRTTSSPPDPTTAPMFWDNRTRSLEAQVRGPIEMLGEMRGPSYEESAIFPELVTRLTAIPEYLARFEAAFGSPAVDELSIMRAIAAFERTLVSTSSYDRHLRGDALALSAQQKRGLAAFHGSGCDGCHSGPMLSDYTLHRFTRGGEALRTPSLRNVTRTAPYMHDGRAPTLDAVFEVYRRVDRDADPKLRQVQVPAGASRQDIAAFLEAASDGDFDRTVPDAVPSGLTVGGKAGPDRP